MTPQTKNYTIPLIIFTNLMPIYGVLNLGWTLFTVIYIYWVELLIISFFELLQILTAKDGNFALSAKLFIGFKFMAIRLGIFFFYLSFLITFTGFMLSNKDDASSRDLISMAEALAFKGTFYRITLLSIFFSGALNFYFNFIANQKYKQTTPLNAFSYFDAHIIIVHIVVVLSTFLYKGMTEKMHLNHLTAIVACVSLFVVIKIVVDILRALGNERTDNTTPKDIYI